MQHQSRAMARRVSRGPAIATPGAVLSPPRIPRLAGGLSGRPTCRIYARGDGWVLEFDTPNGGWIEDGAISARRLTFPSLAAAVSYAERHGLAYRIEPPQQHRSVRRDKPARDRLPRSWLARLASNGRKGDLYHG